MKHFLSIITAIAVTIIAPFAVCAQSLQTGSKITVSPPALQNGGEADAWVPLFVQGQLTTDFQNYSGLTVIDRQAAAQLMGEQAIKEQNAFVSDGDTGQIQYASLIDADYTIVVQLVKKGTSYALTCSIQDVKNATPFGKAYSNANVPESALNDGSAIHAASYELLKGVGVAEASIAALKTTTKEQQAEVNANVYTAKGIAVEQSGGSMVEAMAYYQKAVGSSKAITEGAARLGGITATLSGVSIGTVVLNDIQLRNQWAKIWDDMHTFAQNNWAYIVYDPSLLLLTHINYDKNTANLELPVAVKLNPEVQELYFRLLGAYKAVPKQGDWNLGTGLGTGTLGIGVAIYDGDGNFIGESKIVNFSLNNTWYYSLNNTLYRDEMQLYYFKSYTATIDRIDPNKITGDIKIEVKPFHSVYAYNGKASEGGIIRTMKAQDSYSTTQK